MHEILSITTPQITGQYRLSPLIQGALTHLLEKIMENSGRQVDLDEPNYQEGLKKTLGLYPYTGPFEDVNDYEIFDHAEHLFRISYNECSANTNIIKNYFENTKLPQGVELFIFGTSNGLKHYDTHTGLLLIDFLDKIVYAFSPANAYNPDGALPELKGEQFQRMNDIIASSSIREALEALSELEKDDPDNTDWVIYDASWNQVEIQEIEERLLHEGIKPQ